MICHLPSQPTNFWKLKTGRGLSEWILLEARGWRGSTLKIYCGLEQKYLLLWTEYFMGLTEIRP